MQKKVIIVPIIALTFAFIFTPHALTPIRAISPSPTPSLIPSPTPTDINEVTENIKKRVQDALNDPTVKAEPSESPLGYVGMVKDIIKDTVIIEDKDGKKDVKLTLDTTILRSPGTATIKPENIRIDDYIIAIGYPAGDSENIVGKRLIVSADAITPPTKTAGLGTIVEIGKTSITLKVDGSDHKLSINAKTIYKSAVGIIELEELNVGDTLIYTATKDAKDVLTASILMRIQTVALAQ